jgi:hypothetical protein
MSGRSSDALFEGAVIVAANEEPEVYIVWNGSATFNWWVVLDGGAWENTDAFTVYGEGNPGGACTLKEALQAGREAMREELQAYPQD